MGKARNRVDDQQNVFAPVAEIFGDAHGGLGRQAAHHRAFVAGGDHGDRALARPRPSASSRNSRTSRPRSPTSAMTAVSKPGERASMASSVDLPTPEPAKMPMRCPAQSGVKKSMTLTPVFDGRADALRGAWRLGGSRRCGRGRSPWSSGPGSSMGCAERVDDAALPGVMRADGDEAARARRWCRGPPSTRASKGLTVTPCSSMRTTSPSWRLPADVERYALAELDEGRQAGNAAEGGSDLGDHAADAHRFGRSGCSSDQPIQGVESMQGGRRQGGGAPFRRSQRLDRFL